MIPVSFSIILKTEYYQKKCNKQTSHTKFFATIFWF